MMSRRESRVSMNVRQNDALFEFENFKKKFLLANKHITKLNSTLSVRIEELNAQISTLYVENLRLRASEIALAAQLKREREKSRKIMAEAEAATLSLTKHLNYLRQTFNIKSGPTAPPTPPSPRARKPLPNQSLDPTTPQGPRISRPPNFPGIYEEEEPCITSSEADAEKPSSPARRKSKSKPRLSASKLPLPTRAPSPPPSSFQAAESVKPVQMEIIASSSSSSSTSTSSKRRPGRRQSGLLTVDTSYQTNGADGPLGYLPLPRPASPAFGSPIRREAGLAEEQDELTVMNGGDVPMDIDTDGDVFVTSVATTAAKKEKRRGKAKEREEPELGKEGPPPTPAPLDTGRARDRKRPREEELIPAPSRLKNVTNSPRNRIALLPIDNTVRDQMEVDNPQKSSSRTFLAENPGSPTLPTPRTSISPVPPSDDGSMAGGRERRARKSVNYAEPKLNTKMRKPDPVPGTSTSTTVTTNPPTRKRSSVTSSTTAAIMPSSYKPVSANPNDPGNDADNDTEARSSLELPHRVNGTPIDPEMFPLPPSRPGSAATYHSPGPPTRGPSGSSSSSGAQSVAATSVKRKKSRPQLVIEDEESDGTQADAEYAGGGRGGGSSWVNTEGRRRSSQAGGGKRAAALAALTLIDQQQARYEDLRRHSMAT